MTQTNIQSPKHHSPEAVRLEVEKLYGFSSVEVPRLMNGGMENAAWHFRTDTGDWIVKVFAPYEGLFERVAEEPLLYDYLNKHGINVPRVLRSKRAQQIERLRIGIHEYPVMTMKCENLCFPCPVSIQKMELLQIAQTVARMHQCLKLYPRQRNLMIRDKTNSDNLVIILLKKISSRAAQMYQPPRGNPRPDNLTAQKEPLGYDILAASPVAAAFSSEDLSRIQVLDRQMKAYLGAHSSPSCLTNSFLHGDLALEHTPFLPNGDVYLFDFSNYYWGPVVEDIAEMLERLYVREEITFDRWEELKDWFLTEYNAVSPLPPEDLAAISPSMMRALLLRITYRCNISRKLPGGVDKRYIESRYRLADYLLRLQTTGKPAGMPRGAGVSQTSGNSLSTAGPMQTEEDLFIYRIGDNDD